MDRIRIDADAMYRAVISHDFKIMAYYLDLRSGQITSRTLQPHEVQAPPVGPRVKPLPLLGGDLTRKTAEAPFGPPPVEMGKKPDLFKDDGPKKKSFEGDFWKRDGGQKPDPFGGEGGFKPVSGTKKLAELFGEKPPEQSAQAPRARPAESDAPGDEVPFTAEGLDLSQPLQRIPPARREQILDWMKAFARDCGDPQIKERLLRVLGGEKPEDGFQRILGGYQRLNQQWDRNFRKQALHYAAAWLQALPIQWELVEAGEIRGA